jgi:hypothetical protein
MITNILSTDLREKAGSDTYNRYEYQTHYIVYHIIETYKNQKNLLIFCEFHDDMAACENTEAPSCMKFYQIKTKSDTNKYWTLASLFEKRKRPDGTYKHSFLGYIFYNFNKFSTECSQCHFISNTDFDLDILKWQSIIKDGKKLKMVDLALYNKIKNKMEKEWPITDCNEFDVSFEKFIQNTFIIKTHIALDTYEEQIRGIFFELLSRFHLDTSCGYLLLQEIIETVRQKSTAIVRMPISFSELKTTKSISNNILYKIEKSFKEIPSQDITIYLAENGMDIANIKYIIRKLKIHQNKMLDISDALYQDIINRFVTKCEVLITEHCDNIGNYAFINSSADQLISDYLQHNTHIEIDYKLLKGVFYELLLSDSNTGI